jgi:prepilin-type N-terminal cleavage/methylation domain-containing protein
VKNANLPRSDGSLSELSTHESDMFHSLFRNPGPPLDDDPERKRSGISRDESVHLQGDSVTAGRKVFQTLKKARNTPRKIFHLAYGQRCTTGGHHAMNTHRAFTILELLVVITIIAVLATLSIPIVGHIRLSQNQVAATANFRQLAIGLSNYIGMNNGEFPPEGEDQPTWESSSDPEYHDAWYNSIPRLSGAPGLADFTRQRSSFYKRSNLLYVPAAEYPSDREKRPNFGLSYNSKLRRKGQKSLLSTAIEMRGSTVFLQESGLPGERSLPGQSPDKYDGQTKSYASRTVARYNGRVLLLFADGRAAVVDAKQVVNIDGLAYFPQVSAGGGSVYWTVDPDADPND